MTENIQGDCAKQGKEWAQESESEEFLCNTESSQNIARYNYLYVYYQIIKLLQFAVKQKLSQHYTLTTIIFFKNNKTLSFLGLKSKKEI